MVHFPVSNLRCMFCCYRLKRAIQMIDPKIEVKIDYRAGNVVLKSHDDIHTVERALSHLRELARVG